MHFRRNLKVYYGCCSRLAESDPYNRKTDQAAGLIDFSYVLVGNVAYGLNGRNHFLGVRLPMPSIAPTSLSSIPSSSMLYKYW